MSDWLQELKYVWGCFECKHTVISADNPVLCADCGSPTYLQRCAERMGFVVSDSLDDLMNPVDGKKYDSKSAYYQAVQDAGCNIVEDNPLERKRELRGDFDITKELKDAVQEVEVKTGESL